MCILDHTFIKTRSNLPVLISAKRILDQIYFPGPAMEIPSERE